MFLSLILPYVIISINENKKKQPMLRCSLGGGVASKHETDHRATFASSTDTSLINGDDPSATFSSLYTFKNSFYPVYVFSFSHSRGPLTSY